MVWAGDGGLSASSATAVLLPASSNSIARRSYQSAAVFVRQTCILGLSITVTLQPLQERRCEQERSPAGVALWSMIPIWVWPPAKIRLHDLKIGQPQQSISMALPLYPLYIYFE